MRTTAWRAGIALTMVVLLAACETRLTGNEGNLTFSYTADDDVTNFNKPVAVGAKLEVRIEEVGTDRDVEVTSAEFDDPEILAVDTFAGNRVIVEGVGEGNGLLNVGATVPSGEEVSDSVNMSAAVPEVLVMKHSCTGEPRAHYLVGTDDASIPFDMEKENGQPVIGYGYHPIEIEPAEGAELNQTSTDQTKFHLDLAATAQEVTLSSTIDDSELTLVLVEEAAIDGVDGDQPEGGVRLASDESRVVHFFPTIGGERLCQGEAAMEAASTTPDVCTVSGVGEQPGEQDIDSHGWVRIEGKAFGTCEYTVTFVNGNDGDGASADFTAEVGEFPDDES